MTVNARDSEDLSAHMRHISTYCKSLQSLSVSYLTLPSPNLLRMKPLMHLEELSLSWLHTTPASIQAILDATPRLRQFSVFMAGGCSDLNLRLPSTLEHIDLAYARLDTCRLTNASSLRSVSLRDMFLREVEVCDAPELSKVSIATASVLSVSVPDSASVSSLDLKAACLDWESIQRLVHLNGGALASVSFDFFSSAGEGRASRIFSLPWLAATCPNLKSLQLGALPWELLTASVLAEGFLLQRGVHCWPALESLQVQLDAERAESLLLLHAFLCNVRTLKSVCLKLSSEEEDDAGAGEEGEGVGEGSGEMDAEQEGQVDAAAGQIESQTVDLVAGQVGKVNDGEKLSVRRKWRRHIFLRGVMALKQRFPAACVSMTLAY